MVDKSSKKQIKALNEQVKELKLVIEKLQLESDKKELVIVKLTEENEKLSLDLRSQKHSATLLLKQLEDERNLYYKEKQVYCKEMSECKKIKKNLSTKGIINEKTLKDFKDEISKLKGTLEDTLVTNYNLSIKYLRMKNSKTLLKNTLESVQAKNEEVVTDFKKQINIMTNQITDIMNEKFMSPMSPSNKKFLKLVNRNNSLAYENLCLNQEIQKLNNNYNKLKMHLSKSESNSHLRYIKVKKQTLNDRSSEGKVKEEITKQEDLLVPPVPSFSPSTESSLPTIDIINEIKHKENKTKSSSSSSSPLDLSSTTDTNNEKLSSKLKVHNSTVSDQNHELKNNFSTTSL